ncbi:hypothetical protein [Kribbella sp. NPDC051718]|uniref:hypothetical protein n=1 Tax=Kribbella sp. NPDC051718 TaxID=3155168 RepID=UPI00342652EC
MRKPTIWAAVIATAALSFTAAPALADPVATTAPVAGIKKLAIPDNLSPDPRSSTSWTSCQRPGSGPRRSTPSWASTTACSAP